MKLKRNGAMVFWSCGGIGGSVYATRNTRIFWSDVVVPTMVGVGVGLLTFAVVIHIIK
jgi:hypothetical protein